MAYVPRRKVRTALGISLEEYCSWNIYHVREFQTEAIMNPGYIGWFDAWNGTIRVFVFDGAESRDKALKAARSIGFETAGAVEGNLFLYNSELRRPHLERHTSRSSFYTEYYR